MKRKRSDKKSTLQTIVIIAEKEFAKNGFDRTTVRDIAKGAGVNVAMIYYYFKTKEELHAHILDKGFEKLSTLLKERLCNDMEPEDKIFGLISTYIHFFHSNKNMQKVILREMVSGGRRLDMIIKKYIARYFDYFKTIIKDGIKRGMFMDVDPDLTILSLMGMIFYFFNHEPVYTKLISNQKKEGMTDYLPRHIHNIFMNGLKKR